MGLVFSMIKAPQVKQWLAVVACIVLALPVLYCQKKWTGRFNDQWDQPLNWQPVGVPSASDNVILDNSLLNSDYKVFLPDQVTTIHSLLIEPAPAKQIELALPASNVASPALQVYESGNSIVIRSGGVFRNSSGLNSGQSLLLNGLMCIYNNGMYVHNSRSAHAADIVAKLSTLPGTEHGIFEYDVPGGSYPVSLSNRSYGTLVFSSIASGGTQTYNASGTNQVVVNGDLRINNGVQVNIDLTKDMIINGSYIQPGGVFNLASQNNNNVVIVKGDVSQDKTGMITESAGGLPVFELSGNSQQLVSLAGMFANNVTLRINNQHGIILGNHMSLAFKLQLVKGKIKSSSSAFITLLDNCTVTGASADSFVDGPLRKVGDEDFEFPVGKESDYAPVRITGTGGHVTDEFTATYFLANPASVYGPSFENPPVVRISSLEYWTLEQSAGSPARKVTLTVGTYSQATALEHLVVVRWDKQATRWINTGNSSYSGITTGSITSADLHDFGAFTLASTAEMQNPLPLSVLNFSAGVKSGGVELHWGTAGNISQVDFEVEKSLDGKLYQSIARVHSTEGTRRYQFRYAGLEISNVYFRLKVLGQNGEVYYSKAVKVSLRSFNIIKIYPVVVRSELNLEVQNGSSGELEIFIGDYAGRLLKHFTTHLEEGENTIKLDVGTMAKGNYLIWVKDLNGVSTAYTFFKQ